MIPRDLLQTDRAPYTIDEEEYQRFPVYRQAFVSVSVQDTGKETRVGFIPKMLKSLNEKIQNQEPGYSQIDNALDLGADVFDQLVGKDGDPNTEFLQWNPTLGSERKASRQVDLSPEELTEKVKQATALYGADLTGIANLDERWVYSEDMVKPFVFTENGFPEETEEAFHIPKTMNRAIVMAFVMEEDLLACSPGVAGNAATSIGYSRMAIAAVSLARYIRALGYQAIPCMNGTALSIPLAIDAGLGQLGRHGLLITPEYGSNIRLGKVLTDLPLIPDHPIDFGVTEFCNNCLLCAKSCPSGSISTGERTMTGEDETGNPGALKWYIQGESCLRFWQANGTSCSNCIIACPFTQGFEWLTCSECETCEIYNGSCYLQTNTEMRKEYGYLEDTSWGSPPKRIKPRRSGL
jgi:reductive dehalogenase